MKKYEWDVGALEEFKKAYAEAYDFAKGTGKPCGGSYISQAYECRVGAGPEPEKKKHGIGETVKHQGAHLAQSVAAWEVGKVVGGMASQYLESQYGIPAESSKLLAETMVQGTAATALAVATKDVGKKQFLRRAMTEYAAAFLGKSAHGGVETAMSSIQSRAIVEQGAPLIAGKATGLSTAIAGAKVPTVAKMTSTVVSKASEDTMKTIGFLKTHMPHLNFAEVVVDREVVEFLTDIFVLTGLIIEEGGDMPFSEAYDFTRCQRPDGSYYGTSGQCRKGAQVGAKEKEASKKKSAKKPKAKTTPKSVPSDMKKELAGLESNKKGNAEALNQRFKDSKKEIGEGSYGAVKETAEGTVIKQGMIGKNEIAVQEKLAGVDGVPKLVDYAYTSKPYADRGGDRKGIVEMEKVKGKPVWNTVLDKQMDGTMTPKFATKLTDQYLGLRKQIHTRGVAHGDMHENNITWDGKKMGVLDFGLSKPSYKAALNEALGTFGMKGRAWDPRSEDFLQSMRFEGSKSARATKLERKIESIQKKAGGSITEKRAQQLIEELYDGI
jgi:hypothetical protein